jgi:hypothetical protein
MDPIALGLGVGCPEASSFIPTLPTPPGSKVHLDSLYSHLSTAGKNWTLALAPASELILPEAKRGDGKPFDREG